MKRSSVRGVVVVAALALGAVRAGAQEPPSPSAEELRAQLEAVEARLAELEAREAARRLGEPDPLAPPPAGEAAAPASAPATSGDVATVTTEGLLLKLPLSTSLEVRGHLRVRGEARNPADYRVPGTFGRPATANPDDAQDFILQRAWIGFDFRFHDNLHAVVSVMDSRLWGDTNPGQDTAETFVREAYVEARDLFGEPLGVRIGRGLLPNLGDQRLFSNLDWANVPRIWDSVQLTYEPKGWMLTAFASNLREAQVQTPVGDENDDFWLVGAYASCRMIEKHELDAYVVWRELSDDVFASEARAKNGFTPRQGDREDWTLGMRFKGETGPVGYSAEGVYQYGRQAGDTVDAWAAAAKAWFTQKLDDEGKKVRLGLEYAFASGDQDPNDGRNETFDPLFPFGHFYHGHMDLMGWRNMHAVSAQLAVFPLAWLSLHADGHVFWLDKRSDAWYGPAKTAIRRDATGAAGSHLGTELDLYVQVRLWENRLFLWTGYSHFWTGEYVRDTGKSEDQDWAFCQLEFNF